MSRYEQRKRKLLRNPDVAEGYWEMDSELELMRAFDAAREQLHLSTEEVARRMGRHREALSRILNSPHPNPQLDTLTRMLKALDVTADIHLRRAREGEPPMRVTVDVNDVA